MRKDFIMHFCLANLKFKVNFFLLVSIDPIVEKKKEEREKIYCNDIRSSILFAFKKLHDSFDSNCVKTYEGYGDAQYTSVWPRPVTTGEATGSHSGCRRHSKLKALKALISYIGLCKF